MAAVDLSPWEGVAAGVAISVAVAAGLCAYEAYRTGRMRRGWRWLRVQALGGVTTLEQKLNYSCSICQYSLEVHEKVRKLSCGHVFHCGGTEKCKDSIEKWLCERNMMNCPQCREIPRIVWPWQARPPVAAPATSSSASSSSSSSLPPPEQSAAGSSSAPPPVSEEEPLLVEREPEP